MNRPGWITALAAVAFASAAHGQVVPPFFGGVAAYNPQIGIINSGTLLDAQVVVSADRRYVTMNARPTLSNLIAIERFSISQGPLPPQGFVGGVNPLAAPSGLAPAAPSGITPAAPSGRSVDRTDPARSPASIDRAAQATRSVLSRRGMIRLD